MSLAGEIARSLGHGKEEKNGAGWVTCCPVHGDKTPSLAVTDKGNGDVDVFCHTGCNFAEVKDTLRSMGLLPEWAPEKKNGKKSSHAGNPPLSPTAAPESTEHPEAPPEKTEPEKESYIWKQSDKDGLDHAKQYFASRGITIDPLPVCLKWNSYTDKKTGETNNMIVAAASQPADEKVFAVQRLFIDLDNHKKTGAKMHGPCDGRGIWFNRKGDKAEIVVGEGIETVLSVIQATGKNGVAALSTAGMKGLIIPDETNVLYLAVDSDPVREKESSSMPGQKAAYVLAERFEASREGRKAFLVSPDDTCFSTNPAKLDFNDLLKTDPSGGGIRKQFEKAIPFTAMQWKPPVQDPNAPDQAGDDGFYPPKTIEALAKMNKEYAAVLLGGDFRIAKEGYDHAARKHTLSFLKITSLYSYFANTRVGVPVGENRDIEYRELAKTWMTWNGRRTYDDVVFDPSEKTRPNVYNLFKGFPLEPKQGDWSLMRSHIFKVICDSNAEHFAYVMAWMARAVQDPGGDKPGVAIVLKGGKGIGKGVFVNYFGSIFGEAFLPISDSESFTGRFNMHLSKSLVVFLDEAVWGGDKKAEGKLKQLITEPTILFEPKGIDSITLGNYINVIIASNEEWVVPATGDERRFCVLEPSEDFKQNTEYFGKIAKERRNGGAEAMMYDLMRHDYSDIDLRKAPITDGLSEQVQESLPSVLDFWHSVIDRGYMLSHKETGVPVKSDLIEDVAPINELWPGAVYKYEVYAEYTQWCRVQNERYIKNEVHFWRNTWKIWDGGQPERRKMKGANGKVLDCLFLPALSVAKDAFTQTTKIKFEDQEITILNGAKQEPLPFSDQF
ncbi:MAG TPA: hypothetical protein DCZ63_15075 [Geobacter sp.]|nr:hypothetical protein [Geobacter sp.]